MKIKSILCCLFMIATTNVFAQEFKGLQEGQDYIKTPTKEVVVESKKPVVVEFFWYGCGHCFAMKPMSKELFKKYDKKIVSLSYPAAFENWKSGAQIYFTLEQMGVLSQMHDKVFEEIHVNKSNILKKDDDRNRFLKANGIDVEKFNSSYNSFSVTNKVTKATKIVTDLKIESTPSYVIYYKGSNYQVSPSMTKSYEKTIQVLDVIISTLSK